jgi:hypothetical protein
MSTSVMKLVLFNCDKCAFGFFFSLFFFLVFFLFVFVFALPFLFACLFFVCLLCFVI